MSFRIKMLGELKITNSFNSAGSRNMWTREFDVVIIDEATQALEAECWIALLKAKKAILVIENTRINQKSHYANPICYYRQEITYNYHLQSKHLSKLEKA